MELEISTRWNAASSGPKKDIVGIWREAARKRGLRFGVSEHLSNSFDWLAPSHRADKSGEYAGVNYDGADPAYAALYHDYSGMPVDFVEFGAGDGTRGTRHAGNSSILTGLKI